MNSNTTFVKAEDKWVDEHPSGWTIKRADFVVFSHRKQISPEDMEGQIVYHYSIPAIQKTGTGAIEEGDDLDSGKLVIDQPQVLVSKLNPRKGTVCLVDQSEDMLTIASTEFVPLIPKNANLQYVFYVWKSEKIIKRLSSFVQSVTKSHQRCQPSDILKIKWAWPDLDTQEAIVNFLDEKTAHIDALIVKKRELLKLLAENRAAIITHAVTKGINPDVPMKDSGIDWLGVVPKDWQRRRLKFSTTLVNKKIEATDLEITYVGLEHMQSWTGKLDLDNEISFEGTANAFVEGDVLFGKLRPYLAKVHLADISGICSTEILVLRAQEKLLPKYLKYYLLSKSAIENINSSAYGSKMPRANWEFIGGQLQLLPPKEEQKEITNFLDKKTAHIDALIEKNRKLLELLAEKRAAIITNAVTGKIKVA